jgi:hypothetical protein
MQTAVLILVDQQTHDIRFCELAIRPTSTPQLSSMYALSASSNHRPARTDSRYSWLLVKTIRTPVPRRPRPAAGYTAKITLEKSRTIKSVQILNADGQSAITLVFILTIKLLCPLENDSLLPAEQPDRPPRSCSTATARLLHFSKTWIACKSCSAELSYDGNDFLNGKECCIEGYHTKSTTNSLRKSRRPLTVASRDVRWTSLTMMKIMKAKRSLDIGASHRRCIVPFQIAAWFYSPLLVSKLYPYIDALCTRLRHSTHSFRLHGQIGRSSPNNCRLYAPKMTSVRSP